MELTDPRSCYEDVLGFTNQTAVLLCGMGAKDLLPRFKQRNVSTEVLAELTLEDLQLMGADSELANRMRKQLNAISKRNSRSILTPQQRLDQLLEALVNSNKHLSLIQAFVTYARLRIDKDRLDSFIEKNSTLRSSEALEIAVAATISEIQEAREAMDELRELLEDKRSSRNFSLYLAVLGGVGLLTCVLFKKYV